MRTSAKNILTRLLMGAALLTVLSCTKESEPSPCDGINPFGSINFKILDKDNNQDLFFSDSPIYQASQIKVLYKTQSFTPEVLRSEADGRFFHVAASGPARLDTCYIKIGDLPADTLIFNIQEKGEQLCAQFEVNKVIFNDITEDDAQGRVLSLKR